MFSEIIHFLYSLFLIPFVLFPTFVGCTVKKRKPRMYVAAATLHFQNCFPFPSLRPCVAASPKGMLSLKGGREQSESWSSEKEPHGGRFQCLFGLHVTWSVHLYSLAEAPQAAIPPPPPPALGLVCIRGRYWSAKIDDISVKPPEEPHHNLWLHHLMENGGVCWLESFIV
jgi:hypothetical protein